MKSFFIILIFVLGISTMASDEEYYYHRFTYEQFIPWMQSVNIPGYKLQQTEVNGSEETYNVEYSAMFSNEINEGLNVRIGHPNVFYGFEDLPTYNIEGPYELEGMNVVYFHSPRETKPSNLSYFLVQLKNLEATFSITALTRKTYSQEQFENLFRIFNLPAIESKEFVQWPDEIPIEFRLPGNVKEIEKQDVDDPILKSQYLVTAEKSAKFLRDLRRFYEEKRGWLDLATFMDITLVCKTTDDFTKLDKLADGEIVEFVYYLKGSSKN